MYPKLTRIIRSLALDNGIHCLPADQWVWPDNVKQLEDEAGLLPDDEVDTFVNGEYQEIVAAAGHGIRDLNTWVESLFDGEPEAGTFYRRIGR